MNVSELTVSPENTIREVIACIDRNEKGIALVVDEARKLLATLTDGDIRRADALVGDLVSALERLGLLRDTLLIVTSDHGEALEGRLFHGHSLYDELLRVPLVVHYPRGVRRGRRIEVGIQIGVLLHEERARLGQKEGDCTYNK